MSFKNLKIKSIAWIVSIILLVIAITNFLIVRSTNVSNGKIFSVSKSIEIENIAHRLNFAIGVLASSNDPNNVIRENIKKINKMRAEYQAALSILYNGGIIRVKQGSVYNTYILDPAEGKLKVSLTQLKKEWSKYQKDMNGFINQKNYTSDNHDISWLPQKYASFIDHNAKVKTEFYNDIIIHKKRANIVGWVLLLTNILILFILYFLLRRVFFKPINLIKETSRKLTLGDLSSNIPYDNDNEFGSIAKNINKLADVLMNATTFSKEIGQGNLDVEYKGADDTTMIIKEGNIIYELQSMRNKLKEVAEKDRQERWVNKGLAKFSKILRNSENEGLDAITYDVISNLVTYLEASQGILYLYHEDAINIDNSYLESKAVYALNKRKVLDKKVKKGEGLVGQAFLDQETLYINDVPDHYEKIGSALGETNARSILVLPLTMGENIQGALEILSLKAIEPYQINFVQRVSENIASTLSISRNNEKTRQIMQDSKELEKRVSRRG